MDRAYRLLNLLPMPVWLLLMLAPQQRAARRVARSPLLGAMALPYLAALVGALRRGGGSVRDAAQLDGLSRLLGTREGALATWAHLLAMDLFAGAWVAREADRLRAPLWVRLPSLLGTLMAGPLGVGLFLLWRASSGAGALDEQGPD